MSNRHEIHWAVVIGLYGVLLSLIYYETILWLITHDWIRGDYDYCYLIPAILIYLIWEKRAKLGMLAAKPSNWGILVLLLGILMLIAGRIGAELFTMRFSLIILLAGLIIIAFVKPEKAARDY